jgi:hypothetical protein
MLKTLKLHINFSGIILILILINLIRIFNFIINYLFKFRELNR